MARIEHPRKRYLKRDGSRPGPAHDVPQGHREMTVDCQHNADWPSRSGRIMSVVVEGRRRRQGPWVQIASFTTDGIMPEVGPNQAGTSLNPRWTFPLPPGVISTRTRLQVDDDLTTRLQTETRAGPRFQPGTPPQSVAYDSVGSTTFANVTSASYTHSPSGTPTGIAIGLVFSNVATTKVMNVIASYNSVTAAIYAHNSALGSGSVVAHTFLFGVPAPDSGDQTVAASWAQNNYGGLGSVAVVGGDTTQLFSSPGQGRNNSTTSSSHSSTCVSATDELVVDIVNCFNSSANTATVGSGQTQRVNAQAGGSNTKIIMSTEPGGASIVMAWTASNSSTYWTSLSMSFKEPDAGGGSDSGARNPLRGPIG